MRSQPYGSSPRSRGTPSWRRRYEPAGRFIPALAGNTWPAAPAPEPGPVHPRARGEHSMGEPSGVFSAGSSPRSRGTPCTPITSHLKRRFIPALAGNTAGTGPPGWHRTVHPRARGEHLAVPYALGGLIGSSPRSRGTPRRARPTGTRSRFIPALAGNTPVAARSPSAGPVHPRARGEHSSTTPHHQRCTGSSPRSRGTLFL